MILPNQGIIWIEDKTVGAEQRSAPTETASAPTGIAPGVAPGSLGAIVRAYKSAVTYAVNALQNQRGAVLWQRNYYEHIIRNDRELNNIRWYILNNPLNWQLDRDNSRNIRKLSPPEHVEEYVQDVRDMVSKV